MSAVSSRIAVAKAVIGAIVVLDLFTLAGLSIHTTTTTRTDEVVAASPSSTPPSGTVPDAVPAPDIPLGGEALAAAAQEIATPGTTTTPPVTKPPADSDDPAADDDVVVAKCPIALPEPAQSGGLQSLIGFAPAFGPFKDEAFAPAAAYQPVLQLLGPILAQYPKLAPQIEPTLLPLLDAWGSMLDSGFAILGPYYAPYRTQVLDAEAKLAEALAPAARELAGSPLAGCLLDVEAALVNDTKPAEKTESG